MFQKSLKIGDFWLIFLPPRRFGADDVTWLASRHPNYDTTHSEEAPILSIYDYMGPPTIPQEEF